MRVFSNVTLVPAFRNGGLLLRGCRSMNCSPMADLLATTTRTSPGMSGALFSMSRRASTPLFLNVSLPTRPTSMPRYVTWAPAKMPPESLNWALTGKVRSTNKRSIWA